MIEFSGVVPCLNLGGTFEVIPTFYIMWGKRIPNPGVNHFLCFVHTVNDSV